MSIPRDHCQQFQTLLQKIIENDKNLTNDDRSKYEHLQSVISSDLFSALVDINNVNNHYLTKNQQQQEKLEQKPKSTENKENENITDRNIENSSKSLVKSAINKFENQQSHSDTCSNNIVSESTQNLLLKPEKHPSGNNVIKAITPSSINSFPATAVPPPKLGEDQDEKERELSRILNQESTQSSDSTENEINNLDQMLASLNRAKKGNSGHLESMSMENTISELNHPVITNTVNNIEIGQGPILRSSRNPSGNPQIHENMTPSDSVQTSISKIKPPPIIQQQSPPKLQHKNSNQSQKSFNSKKSNKSLSNGSTTTNNNTSTFQTQNYHEVFPITLHREHSVGLGFSIAGGSQESDSFNGAIYITKIILGGAAHADGRLKQYDIICSVNGINTEGVPHEVAVDALKDAQMNAERPVNMVIKRDLRLQQSNSINNGMDNGILTDSYMTTDNESRLNINNDQTYSPSLNKANKISNSTTQNTLKSPNHENTSTNSPNRTPTQNNNNNNNILQITLTKSSNGLGISIAGGIGNQHIEDDNSIFVTQILEGGAAHMDGRMMVNDRLIDVDDHNLEEITHDEAVHGFG